MPSFRASGQPPERDRVGRERPTLSPASARLSALPLVELADGRRVRLADSAGARRRGLARLSGLTPADALLLPRCRSVHTFGMRCALELHWLDAHGEVIRVDEAVAPRRVRTCLRARSVLEVPRP